MKLIPLRAKLLVKIIPDLTITKSGLYLAQTIEQVPHRGTVIALGTPYTDRKGKQWPWGLEKGEIVHFKRNWTNQKEEYIILLREDIFTVENERGIRAARDMVIIERVYTGRIGDSSLVIPDGLGIQSNYGDFYGRVISVGPENKMGINVGDKLIYHRNEGLQVKFNEHKDYFSLKPRAILAKID